MSKDKRSSLNPFTGKEHFDIINDDKFLEESSREYYKVLNQSTLLDDTSEGRIVSHVARNLINAVENYLNIINRSDYTKDYYEWDFHLVDNDVVNAFCMPGGKIVVFSGILTIADTEEKLAFILAHEMAHALLDHSRTAVSAQNAKNGLASLTFLGSFALDLVGLGEIGTLTRAATNVASVGSDYFLLKPFGRSQEIEADKLGIMIAHWAGYNIQDIPNFWVNMSKDNPNNFDFFSTHPADSKRIEAMSSVINDINNQKDFYLFPVLGDSNSKINNFTSNSQTITCPNCGSLTDKNDSFCCNCGYNLKNTLKCPICGSSIKLQDKFCSNCGNNLKEIHCPNCNAVINSDDSFCSYCGYKLKH